MKVFSKKSDVSEKWIRAVKKPVEVSCTQINDAFEVKTLEGVMKGKAGDWLIEGVEGELYACDNTIFNKTYNLK